MADRDPNGPETPVLDRPLSLRPLSDHSASPGLRVQLGARSIESGLDPRLVPPEKARLIRDAPRKGAGLQPPLLIPTITQAGKPGGDDPRGLQKNC